MPSFKVSSDPVASGSYNANDAAMNTASAAALNVQASAYATAKATFLAAGSAPSAYPAYAAALKAADISYYTALVAASTTYGFTSNAALFAQSLQRLNANSP